MSMKGMLQRLCPCLKRFYSSHPYPSSRQLSIADLYSRYKSDQPITMLTAYDYITATWAQEAQCDMILVGDSLAMCSLGYPSTTDIGLDEFKYHVKSVCRAQGSAFIVVDMPFGSFESSLEKGIETAISLMKLSSKVGAVKLEVGSSQSQGRLADYSLRLAQELCARGIPVMGHVGLTPQRVHALSGYKVQGNKSSADSLAIFETAQELQRIGCFSIVLECVPHKISQYITNHLKVPTIGIGAGNGTSGQVLVQSDMLGMLTGQVPKFVHKYGNFHKSSVEHIRDYIKDVTERRFPDNSIEGFKVKDEVWLDFIERVEQA